MEVLLIVGTKTVVGDGDRDWRNTALVLDKGRVLGEYYKARPVHFFNDGIPGREFTPMQTRLGAFGTPVCFDCDYTEVARRMVQLGAEYFLVPSFDARHWSANQHWQHAVLFRLRAAENARWLAVAASSGVSQIVDPHGRVHASLPLMERGHLVYRIGRNKRKTVFTLVGWLFPWLTLACSSLMVAFAGIAFVVKAAKTRSTRAS
jgi:apolipoprotein N-acyltransferase